MEKVKFLGLNCVCLEVISRDICNTDNDIIEFHGLNVDYVRIGRSEKRILKEIDIARKHLEQGKGVEYKNFVYFLEEQIYANKYYIKFKDACDKKISKCKNYMDGLFYDCLKDVCMFEILRGVINLYHTGFFSEKAFKEKLNSYLKPEKVELFYGIYQGKKAV
ncbi:MAG: hypothetical protein K0R54_71 [Clostridiaceae bacterium]|jgi:hypothetical protein|nr:hypothetical protein [Clostridiaceae bacterium]